MMKVSTAAVNSAAVNSAAVNSAAVNSQRQSRKRAAILGKALTVREAEVAALLCQGKSVKDISTELNISHKTANVHAVGVYAKMGVHTRFELFVKMKGPVIPTFEKVHGSVLHQEIMAKLVKIEGKIETLLTAPR